MSLYSFTKDAGVKIIDLLTPGNAHAPEQLLKHIESVGLGSPDISPAFEGHKIILGGEAASQEEKEKLVLASGNVYGVATVDDQITVTGPDVQAARFVTVKAGDTLAAIAKSAYGDASKYAKVFEANRPLLQHPDKIYPGQVLRLTD
ncbi:peptidoglycan-binding protein LysM [Streptomyces sp. NPDC006641]|uniref:peptidoglycan-binding protein LysM n=1 Tax=unclassified Streptomyces TaxID=2593676 RepID=UPI002E79B611|nr:peptidoglycan-binding protein LysM [Streptomyces sp. JV184]MEE1746787.1 peptidoglycan-binding protein LysM [Streptomyces sp. JV184]